MSNSLKNEENIMNRLTTTLLVALLTTATVPNALYAQDPTRYLDVVEETFQHTLELHPDSPVIFAGSSHLKSWTNLSDFFPPEQVIDHGFEGSQTSDLIYFANELVLAHKPSKIFIYEGDNDLANGKSVDIVLADLKTLFHVIRRQLPETPIYLISPRPSPARLEFRPKYEELNFLLSQNLCPEKDITFINVWDDMIDEYGDVKEDLFIEDGLHLNQDGYKIWVQAIAPHLN